MTIPTNHDISDYDFQIIITSVMGEFENTANPTTDGFEAVYRSSMRCYLRGRNIDFTNLLLAEVMSLVADEARRETQYAVFCYWVERTHEDVVAKPLLDWGKTGLGANAAILNAGMGYCGVDAIFAPNGTQTNAVVAIGKRPAIRGVVGALTPAAVSRTATTCVLPPPGDQLLSLGLEL